MTAFIDRIDFVRHRMLDAIDRCLAMLMDGVARRAMPRRAESSPVEPRRAIA